MAGESQESEFPTGASTGDGSGPSQTPRKSKSQVGQLWDEFGNPNEPSNLYGTYNSAPGKPTEPTVMDATKGLSLANIMSFYKTPCARESLLMGMGSAFSIGGVKVIVGGGTRAIWAASNWAVGSFALVSMAAYTFCQRKRGLELEGMKAAQEMMDELKHKKLKEQEQAKRAAQEAAEEERRRKSWTNLSNYKFW